VEKEEGIRMKQEACGRKLQHFSDSHYPRLVAVEEELSIQADRARAASQFGATESLYLIEGWVQDAQYAALEASLKGKFGKKILVSKAGLSHDEAPPTLLSNPKRAQPFQFLVEFISLPQYSEIDPTIFLTIIIPLMYALIFGDALYAALSFVVSYLIVSKSKEGSILKPVAPFGCSPPYLRFSWGLRLTSISASPTPICWRSWAWATSCSTKDSTGSTTLKRSCCSPSS
jgi:V/A-type H+-transporting ATPase subunit I